MSRSISILAVVLFALGCGTATESNNDEPSPNNVATTDAGNNTSSDPDAGTPDMSEAVEGEFEIGTNVTGQSTPDTYTPMMDGTSVPIVWGVQGSWMVVLAFRTHDIVDGPFDVRANISIDGVDSGEIWLEFQETFPGGDGWDYYYNLFLALSIDDPPAVGTPATITLSVEDGDGATAEVTHEVLTGELVGGPNG